MDSRFCLSSYLTRLRELLAPFTKEREGEIAQFAEYLMQADFVFVVGNGGSLATAAHFAEDLIICGIRAQALTDAAYLTMAANDNSFSVVFNPYLRVWGTPKTVVVGISTSGNSGNVINALRDCKGRSMGLIGQRDSVMSIACKPPLGFAIEVGTKEGPTEVRLAEDVHSILCHMITEYIRAARPVETKRLHESNIPS